MKKIGHGGSADVFLAEHISLSAYRAVKRISKAEKLHDFLLREARILKNLSHPSIPMVYDLEEDSSYSYIIMEYLEGVSLKSYQKEQKMTEQEIGEAALQICRILRYLHGLEPPLLYLDLKPENLMVCGSCIKLIDFGAARFKEEWDRYDIALGTKGYAAPELSMGKKLNERSDIYSFGMLLFFLFTGETPKRKQAGIQNIDCMEGIRKEWKDIVNICLKYSPNLRFTSAAGLEERILSVSNQKKKNPTICRRLYVVGNSRGTSHVCLMAAFSLARQGKKVAYREMEERGIAESLLLWMGGNRKGKPVCHGVRLFRGEEEQEEGEQFDIEIRDYGSIEGSLSQELYQMEHVILVTGVKCWELRELEQILAKFRSPPLLCMNFVSGREFFRLAKNYQQYLCLQVPYQPELLEDSSGQGKKFAQRLWEEAGLCLEKGTDCGRNRSKV